VASDGQMVLDLLNQITDVLPDVVVLDLNMPKMTGFNCLKAIKLDSRMKHIPVVIFTTANSEKMIEKSYKSGATFFATKPYNLGKLHQIIGRILDFDWKDIKEQPDRTKFVKFLQV
jgi:CheY-like chemotaxis protein